MQVIHGAQPCSIPTNGSVVTIGAYDGVHRGHQEVIRTIAEKAAAEDLATAVVTFDRHPASVVRPDSAPLLLTDLEQKLELLDALGVDQCVVIEFDEQRAKESAEHFVESVLVDCLAARKVVVGEDFHFGHQRRGNVDLLRELGAVHGFTVEGLGLVGLDGRRARDHEQVSSTAIRRALARGDLAAANTMLTRAYEVRGTIEIVGPADLRSGTTTVVVAAPPQMLLPAAGAYAGWCSRPDGRRRAAVLTVEPATSPAGDGAARVEAHVIDFDGDDPGGRAHLQFVERLPETVASPETSGLDVGVAAARDILDL